MMTVASWSTRRGGGIDQRDVGDGDGRSFFGCLCGGGGDQGENESEQGWESESHRERLLRNVKEDVVTLPGRPEGSPYKGGRWQGEKKNGAFVFAKAPLKSWRRFCRRAELLVDDERQVLADDVAEPDVAVTTIV